MAKDRNKLDEKIETAWGPFCGEHLAQLSDGRLVMLVYDSLDEDPDCETPEAQAVRAELDRRGLTAEEERAAFEAQLALDDAERRAEVIAQLAGITVSLRGYAPDAREPIEDDDGEPVQTLVRERPEIVALAETAYAILARRGAQALAE